MKLHLLPPVLFCSICVGQSLASDALEALTDSGKEAMYSSKYDQAAIIFGRAAAAYPDNPAPRFFLGLNQLWRAFSFEYDPRVGEILDGRANETIGLADRQISEGNDGGEAYFWRGMGRSLRLAALLVPQALRLEKRNLDPEGLAKGLTAFVTSAAAEADFTTALSRRANLSDARAMLVLLQRCRVGTRDACIADLWRSGDSCRWIGIEMKYILLNLLFSRRRPTEMDLRAIPVALELHLRYPTSGLFHLALAKVSFETGNLGECRAYCSEILEAKYEGSYGDEARYLLGVAAIDDSAYGDAFSYFAQVLRAKPQWPGYLMPWSWFRAAQCAVNLGHPKDAAGYLQNVIYSPSTSDRLRETAQRMLAELALQVK